MQQRYKRRQKPIRYIINPNRMCTTSVILFVIAIKVVIGQSMNSTIKGIYTQIYDNIAEISQPMSRNDLPIIFSEHEWYDIRSDSIRLIGNCIQVRAQKVSFNHASLNGQKILIKRSINNDTYTEGIMIDETRNLVQDLMDNTFYTVANDRIRYLFIPPTRNYSVDFVVESFTNEQLYIRYLQKNIKWKVRYDLLLKNKEADSILQAYAVIINDGRSPLTIDSAELISGDVNIGSSSYNNHDVGLTDDYDAFYETYDQQVTGSGNENYVAGAPTISDAEELIGVYIFTINQRFVLGPASNYILPMFRPIIDIQRYGSIEKYFSSMDNRGVAQRSYRLRVEQTFLPQGKVFVRESDRLVGETYWSDLASNETNEFSLGKDPDLQYIEYVQLNSRRQVNESNSYSYVLSTYTIKLHLINNKSRSINIEYRLRFYSQNRLKLKENTKNNLLRLDGSSIIGTFELNASDEQQFTFTLETR